MQVGVIDRYLPAEFTESAAGVGVGGTLLRHQPHETVRSIVVDAEPLVEVFDTLGLNEKICWNDERGKFIGIFEQV